VGKTYTLFKDAFFDCGRSMLVKIATFDGYGLLEQSFGFKFCGYQGHSLGSVFLRNVTSNGTSFV
jgi:hypothetical protein